MNKQLVNIEVKARTTHADRIRNWLLTHSADFKGTDHQTDTYFNVAAGRLKLREGNIERNLIWYQRANEAGPKASYFALHPVTDSESLKAILAAVNGIKVVVKKIREIYFIANVKFHLDTVEGLGSFVEIEASNKELDISQERLLEQCSYYQDRFGILAEDLIAKSYSDLLLEKD